MSTKVVLWSVFFSMQQLTTLTTILLNSATATDSFHGTGISIIQHRSHESEGHDRGVLVINPTTSSSARSVAPLPSQYTNVPPAALKGKEFTAPNVNCPVTPAILETIAQAKKVSWSGSVQSWQLVRKSRWIGYLGLLTMQRSQ